MRAMVLRLEAPLMSFGNVVVDNLSFTDPLPGKSMITGLLANALGWDRSEGDSHDQLQQRLEVAARADVPGAPLIDYQTADLGQPFMEAAWTSRGAPMTRGGGAAAKRGTHIRYRHYLAGAFICVVVSIRDGDPSLDDLAQALRYPARPLFIGRKPCIPCRPILDGFIEAETLRDALTRVPITRAGASSPFARWPASEGAGAFSARQVYVHDERDWTNQIHVGRRAVFEGHIALVGESS